MFQALVTHWTPSALLNILNIPIPFNRENPWSSLETFTTKYPSLNPQQKAEFAAVVTQFFTEKAYFSKKFYVPSDFKEKFQANLLPVLFQSIGQDKQEQMRVAAVIERVTSIHFKNEAYPEVEIVEEASEGSDTPPPWTFKEKTPASSPATATPPQEPLECENSPFAGWEQKPWDETTPFASIAQFSDRFSILRPSEQSELAQTFFNYFQGIATKNKRIQIPPDYLKKFATVDLGRLLQAVPNDQQRVISVIQMATGLRFTAPTLRHKVHTVIFYPPTPSQRQLSLIGWIPSSWIPKPDQETVSDVHCHQEDPLVIRELSPHAQRFCIAGPGLSITTQLMTPEWTHAVVELLIFAHRHNYTTMFQDVCAWLHTAKNKFPEQFQSITPYLITALQNRHGLEALLKAELGSFKTENPLSVAGLIPLVRYNYASDNDFQIESVFTNGTSPPQGFVTSLCSYLLNNQEELKLNDARFWSDCIAWAVGQTQNAAILYKISQAAQGVWKETAFQRLSTLFQQHYLNSELSAEEPTAQLIIATVRTIALQAVQAPYAGMVRLHIDQDEAFDLVPDFFQQQGIKRFFDDIGESQLYTTLLIATREVQKNSRILRMVESVAVAFQRWDINQFPSPPETLLDNLAKLFTFLSSRYNNQQWLLGDFFLFLFGGELTHSPLIAPFVRIGMQEGFNIEKLIEQLEQAGYHELDFTLARKLCALLKTNTFTSHFSTTGYQENLAALEKFLTTLLAPAEIESAINSLIQPSSDIEFRNIARIEKVASLQRVLKRLLEKDKTTTQSISSINLNHDTLTEIERLQLVPRPLQRKANLKRWYHDRVALSIDTLSQFARLLDWHLQVSRAIDSYTLPSFPSVIANAILCWTDWVRMCRNQSPPSSQEGGIWVADFLKLLRNHRVEEVAQLLALLDPTRLWALKSDAIRSVEDLQRLRQVVEAHLEKEQSLKGLETRPKRFVDFALGDLYKNRENRMKPSREFTQAVRKLSPKNVQELVKRLKSNGTSIVYPYTTIDPMIINPLLRDLQDYAANWHLQFAHYMWPTFEASSAHDGRILKFCKLMKILFDDSETKKQNLRSELLDQFKKQDIERALEMLKEKKEQLIRDHFLTDTGLQTLETELVGDGYTWETIENNQPEEC